MGFFKDVATAFKPSNIAKGIEAARNPPSQEEIDAMVAQLSPEDRAKYEQNMAQVERGRQEARESYAQAKAIEDQHRVLDGPAGRYLHGSSMDLMGDPDEVEAKLQADGVFAFRRELKEKRKGEFKEGLRQSFGVQEVKQIKDPAERAQVAGAERAARDAARAPYLAPVRAEVQISRIATRGRTQLAELLTHLYEHGLAAHPDKVFGVYRVPDRISGPLTPHSEQGRVVEWDIVHEPLPPGARPDPTDAPLVATSFRGDEQWVARYYGQPSVLDEDLALAYCLHAGIAPERCVGLARISEFRSVQGGSEEHNPIRSLVKGVVAIHPQGGDGAFERMRAAAPLDLPADVDGPAGVHIEVLNWDAIGRAVHLKIMEPPPVPSPFPYLPATPQELLRAYLDIVGLRAADCYSAQATVDRPRELVQGGLFTTNMGPKQPCADGKPRMRTTGCQHVVLVYRDSAEYAAGRARWDRYMAEVLQANLRNGLGLRPVVAQQDDLGGISFTPLRAALRVAEAIDRLDDWGAETVPPYRYCWPAAETTIL